MNNTKVLILCAGDGKRWNNYLGVPKQLIPINEEPLLKRTVRLLCDYGYSDIAIITHDDRLNFEGCDFFKPPQYCWTVETLLSTHFGQKEPWCFLGMFFTQSKHWLQSHRPVKVYTYMGGSVRVSLHTLNTGSFLPFLLTKPIIIR